MPPKRKRTPKQPFDQGVNPASQKRQRRQDLTQNTPNRVYRAAPLSPPATARARRRSPLFEPELLATQTAAAAQADDLFGGDDEDITENEDGDPLPEVEDDLELASDRHGVEDYRALQGTPDCLRQATEEEQDQPI
ncbi:MAG: hypothetical protein M1823_006923, partial [Watsoniomyces obsoletus]